MGVLGSLLKGDKKTLFFSIAWNIDAMAGAVIAILTYNVTLRREHHTKMVEQIK